MVVDSAWCMDKETSLVTYKTIDRSAVNYAAPMQSTQCSSPESERGTDLTLLESM